MRKGNKGHKKSKFFDKDDTYFLGKCLVRDADENKKGSVMFHQELTDAGELVATSITAHVKGAGADRVAIEIYDFDPQNLTADDSLGELGQFRPNAQGKVCVAGLYNDDITLQGPDSLEGAFIGFRCVESGTLVGACQLEVFEKGDHPDDEDDDDDE